MSVTCLLAPARIVVDPGHGGHDSGAVGHGLREADLVLGYAMALTSELRWRGHLVLTTRTEDVFVGLSARAALANDWGADVFVSVHANAAVSPAVDGAWVIHYRTSTKGKALAHALFRRLSDVPGLSDSDPAEEVYPDSSGATGNRSLAVLRQTRMPAALVELGFVTNAVDAALLRRPETASRVARALADGVEDWLRRST